MRRGPLRHGWFAAFTASTGLGNTAEEISRLALPLLVLELTQSLGAAAVLRAVQFVPYIAFGSIVGVVVDRVDKRVLLIAADAVGVVLTVAIPVSVLTGAFSLELLYVLAFLLGVIEVIRGVATDFGVLPSLVDERELTDAMGIYLGADRAARIVGPVAGGLAIQAIGLAPSFWIASLAFIPSALVLWRMPAHMLMPEQVERAPLRPDTLVREMGEGFTYIWHHRILRLVCLFMSIGNIGSNGVQTLVLYALSVEQRLPPSTIGFVFSLVGIMAIAGSVSAPQLTRGRPIGLSMLVAQGLVGVSALGLAVFRDVAGTIAMFAARQLAASTWIVYVFAPRQREAPRAMLGRVNGAFRTIILVSNAASPAILSAVQAAAGTPAAFAVGGAFSLAAVAAVAGTSLRHYDIRSVDELRAAETGAALEERADDPQALP